MTPGAIRVVSLVGLLMAASPLTSVQPALRSSARTKASRCENSCNSYPEFRVHERDLHAPAADSLLPSLPGQKPTKTISDPA